MSNHSIQEILRAARKQGFTVVINGTDHYKLTRNGQTAVISATPHSYGASLKNDIAKLRRIGFVWKRNVPEPTVEVIGYDVTRMERVLDALIKAGTPIALDALAQAADITPAAASGVLGDLKRRGFVNNTGVTWRLTRKPVIQERLQEEPTVPIVETKRGTIYAHILDYLRASASPRPYREIMGYVERQGCFDGKPTARRSGTLSTALGILRERGEIILTAYVTAKHPGQRPAPVYALAGRGVAIEPIAYPSTRRAPQTDVRSELTEAAKPVASAEAGTATPARMPAMAPVASVAARNGSATPVRTLDALVTATAATAPTEFLVELGRAVQHLGRAIEALAVKGS